MFTGKSPSPCSWVFVLTSVNITAYVFWDHIECSSPHSSTLWSAWASTLPLYPIVSPSGYCFFFFGFDVCLSWTLHSKTSIASGTVMYQWSGALCFNVWALHSVLDALTDTTWHCSKPHPRPHQVPLLSLPPYFVQCHLTLFSCLTLGWNFSTASNCKCTTAYQCTFSDLCLSWIPYRKIFMCSTVMHQQSRVLGFQVWALPSPPSWRHVLTLLNVAADTSEDCAAYSFCSCTPWNAWGGTSPCPRVSHVGHICSSAVFWWLPHCGLAPRCECGARWEHISIQYLQSNVCYNIWVLLCVWCHVLVPVAPPPPIFKEPVFQTDICILSWSFLLGHTGVLYSLSRCLHPFLPCIYACHA